MTDKITVSRWIRAHPVSHRAGHPRATFWQRALAILIPLLLSLPGLSGAGVAQLVEHLICNQRVGGSIPSASSTRNFLGGVRAERVLRGKRTGWCLLTRVLFVFLHRMLASC